MDDRFFVGLAKCVGLLLLLHFLVKRYSVTRLDVPPTPATQPAAHVPDRDLQQDEMRARMRDFLSSLEDDEGDEPVDVDASDAAPAASYVPLQTASERLVEGIPAREPDAWNGVAAYETSPSYYASV